MKTQSIIAAAILSITGAAFAQGEATYQYPQPVSVAKSRAQVQVELQQARAAGLIVSGEKTHVLPQAHVAGQYSRVASPTMAGAGPALPPNVEGLSFDGRSLPTRMAPTAAAVVASAQR